MNIFFRQQTALPSFEKSQEDIYNAFLRRQQRAQQQAQRGLTQTYAGRGITGSGEEREALTQQGAQFAEQADLASSQLAKDAAQRALQQQQFGQTLAEQQSGRAEQTRQFNKSFRQRQAEFGGGQTLQREQLGQQESQFGRSLAEQAALRAQRGTEFGQSLAEQQVQRAQQGQQFGQQLGQQESQFGRSLAEQMASRGGQEAFQLAGLTGRFGGLETLGGAAGRRAEAGFETPEQQRERQLSSELSRLRGAEGLETEFAPGRFARESAARRGAFTLGEELEAAQMGITPQQLQKEKRTSDLISQLLLGGELERLPENIRPQIDTSAKTELEALTGRSNTSIPSQEQIMGGQNRKLRIRDLYGQLGNAGRYQKQAILQELEQLGG